DSVTSARLEAPCRKALRLDEQSRDHLASHIVMLNRICALAATFDVVHFHIDYLHFPISRWMGIPQLTTLHGRLDLPDLDATSRKFADTPVVSISDAQRAPQPDANWWGTVYHGLPRDLYAFHPERGTYLAFLGRISPEKRVDRAIHIARFLDIPLKIAAKV